MRRGVLLLQGKAASCDVYYRRRRRLLRPAGPPRCTAFKNSVLWLEGCHPKLIVRLLYNFSEEGLKAQVEELLSGLSHDVISIET